MSRNALALISSLTVALAPAAAQDTSGAGWTGSSQPKDVIAARQAVMAELEQLMRPIDLYADGKPGDPAAVHESATAARPLLLALPHLFPPTTNRYGENTEQPETLALPAIWQQFDAFYALAGEASAATTRLATRTEAQDLRTASRALRAACDACHALYLRPYVASSVSDADREFDFDSVLK